MASIAILVGNTEYRNFHSLACCHDDIFAMKELLEATDKYDDITIIENCEADKLKTQLRASIDKVRSPTELFFYFTGHGHLREGEFYHCATNFDSARPNETGLSTAELHTLLRLANAELVVKVIDACHAGALLIKTDEPWLPRNKEGINNLIQIASCLDSQNSLTGNPLSVFTGKFREAALRKTEGPVYYTDIISTLRDEFLANSSQIPFFVSQHTGREQFVDDATRLSGLREILSAPTAPTSDVEFERPPLSLLERLRAADAEVVTAPLMSSFVARLFDKLIDNIKTSDFSEFFAVELTEHGSFEESTARKFIIRVMSNEKRADNFVTAIHTRKYKNPMLGGLHNYLNGDDAYDETWDLRLNCAMPRAQLKISFTPKFINLQRILLVVTCAPSLDHCYVFEIATQHLLRDFGKFDEYGPQASQRWWKLRWKDRTTDVAEQISEKISEIVRDQLESAETRLRMDVQTDAPE